MVIEQIPAVLLKVSNLPVFKKPQLPFSLKDQFSLRDIVAVAESPVVIDHSEQFVNARICFEVVQTQIPQKNLSLNRNAGLVFFGSEPGIRRESFECQHQNLWKSIKISGSE